jgi:hypothetical protein
MIQHFLILQPTDFENVRLKVLKQTVKFQLINKPNTVFPYVHKYYINIYCIIVNF